MPKRGKKYRVAANLREPGRVYDIGEAVALLQTLPKAGFDETVEVVVRLGIDPKKSDQIVRGSLSLPHGIGRTLKVVVFAEGDKADEARAAGAIEVGSGDLADKVLGGWTDFDVAIATPDMMKHVGKLGRVLGPQGKMPSPKAGTVTMNIANTVKEFAAGKIEFRNDSGSNIAAPMGKRSFQPKQLTENIQAFIEHVRGLKPTSSKGVFMVSASLCATMTPGVPLKL